MRKPRTFNNKDKEFMDNILLYSDLQRYEDNSPYYILAFGFAAFVLLYLIVSL